jgi:hypothetical protein
MAGQMRDVNLTCGTIAVELCQRPYVIGVVGTLRCSMQVWNPRARVHVHNADLINVYGPVGQAVLDPLQSTSAKMADTFAGVSPHDARVVTRLRLESGQ